MSELFGKAKDLIDRHDDKVDEALEKAGDQVDERTGNRHSGHVDRGVQIAQERTGDGDQVP